MTKMNLTTDQVHLWFADQADFDADQLQDRCVDWLTQEELARYERFQIAKRRKEYLLGTMLLRTVLSEYASPNPEQWQFTRNAYGKPAIGENLVRQGIFFNLSHSGNRLVLAVSRHPETGVDIEQSNRARRIERIAGRYFSKPEIDAMLKLDRNERLTRFYELWTLKESYIKARGMGLALSLQQFGFELDSQNAIGFFTASELNDEPAAWRFWQLVPGGDYKLALAVKPDAEMGSGTVEAFQKTGIESYSPLEHQILRRSM